MRDASHVRHRGGGHKRHYRVIDFGRKKDSIPAKVERLEYDPNRSAHIALLLYADGEALHYCSEGPWRWVIQLLQEKMSRFVRETTATQKYSCRYCCALR